MKKSVVLVLILALCGTLVFAKGTTEQKPAGKAMEKITYGTWIYYQNPDSETALEAIFKKDTGVTLEVMSFAKDRWEDKLQALYMSGDAPDVSVCPSNMTPLAKQGFLAPIDAYVENHPGFKDMKAKLPQVFRVGEYGGKTYAMAAGTGNYMNFWVRKDVLDKLGVKMPTTMEELVAMLEAFKKVPGPNGQKVIPMTMANSIWPHDVFTTYFGAFNEVTKRDGKYVEYYLTPQFKEYLEFMRDLYKRELLDKEVPTVGYGDVRKKCQTGVALSCIMWDDTGDAFTKGMADNKIEGVMVPVPPFKNPKGTGVFGLSYSPPTSDFCINAKAANPEFVFNKFFDWIFLQDDGIISTSRGVPGFDFTVENGVMAPTKKPNSGVGAHGQKLPPVKPGFQYPFKFDPVVQNEWDNIVLVSQYAKPFFDATDKVYPPQDANRYGSVKSSLYDKKVALVSKFIIGELDYDGFSKEFTKYANEIQLFDIINELNK